MNSTINDHDQPPTWLFVVQSVELIGLILHSMLGSLIARAILRNKVFHPNMRLLIYVGGASWYAMGICRIVSIIGQFIFPHELQSDYIFILDGPHFIPEFLRVLCGTITVESAGHIIIERFVASVKLETYQNQTNRKTVIAGLILFLPSTTYMAYYTFSIEYGVRIALISGVLGTFVLSMFFAVDRWNRRRNQQLRNYEVNYTLAQRFQLSENLRAADLIRWTVTGGGLGSLPILLMIFLTHWIKTSEQMYMLRAIFNLYMLFFIMFIALFTVLRILPWKLDFKYQLYTIRRFFHRRRVSEMRKECTRSKIKSTDGVQLAFDLDAEGKIYFQQLQQAWN
ncbi:hypothetical protein M3Y95_00913600 [Aphelenchoides besseyi]|nr:hypothetical protein M3Y95_00913600 [Aphelenchoides besseyi]